MTILKFIEEVRALEIRLAKLLGQESDGIPFLKLVEQLEKLRRINTASSSNLKELWVLRNKLYSSRTTANLIDDNATILLTKIISDPNLT